MQSSKTKGGLQDFASLTTLKGFIPFSDTKTCDIEDIRGLSKAKSNQFQQRSLNLKKCECKLDYDAKLLLGWELYKPRKFYVNTNQRSRTNSTDVLRRLLIDHITKTNAHGRPTALTRLIEGKMKKPPPKPKYEYGNCLQQTLLFDDHTMQYLFGGKLEYSPPDIDEIYLNATGGGKSERKNPFVEVQLCPTSMYNLLDQPVGREHFRRDETLIDPKTWSKM